MRLLPGLATSDRYLLGRLWSSEAARRQVGNIGAGMQSGGPLQFMTPNLGFPFAGHTDLSLEGIHHRTPEGLRITLAYRLRSCTFPFPFDSIRLVRESFGEFQRGRLDNEESSGGTDLASDQVISTVTGPTPRLHSPIYFESESITDLYTDLRQKQTKPDLIITRPDQPGPFGTPGTDIDIVGGFGTSEPGAGPVPIEVKPDTPQPDYDTKKDCDTKSVDITHRRVALPHFKTLQKALAILTGIPNFTATPRCVDGPDFSFGLCAETQLSNADPWTYVLDGSKNRPKQACIIELNRIDPKHGQSRFGYVLELEDHGSGLLYFHSGKNDALNDLCRGQNSVNPV